MEYKENILDSKEYRQNYLDGINKIIELRKNEAKSIRKEYIKGIFDNQEKYRADFCEMLGWPLNDKKMLSDRKVPKVVSNTLLSEDNEYELYRMQLEVLPDVNMEGLFYKLKSGEKNPVVIAQHGGSGMPETIAGFYESTYNYNDMLQRIQKNHVNIFAPLVLVWSPYSVGVSIDRNVTDAALKRVGSSITAIEVYGIMRAIDYLTSQPFISNVGMVGLSYGGFYTLYTSAIDTRIKSAISCSYFNTRDLVPWVDWVFRDAAYKFDDAEIAALVYPRHLCIEVGDNDDLFKVSGAIESFEKLKDICAKVGTEWVDFIPFKGNHEFYKEDEPIIKLIKDIK